MVNFSSKILINWGEKVEIYLDSAISSVFERLRIIVRAAPVACSISLNAKMCEEPAQNANEKADRTLRSVTPGGNGNHFNYVCLTGLL